MWALVSSRVETFSVVSCFRGKGDKGDFKVIKGLFYMYLHGFSPTFPGDGLHMPSFPYQPPVPPNYAFKRHCGSTQLPRRRVCWNADVGGSCERSPERFSMVFSLVAAGTGLNIPSRYIQVCEVITPRRRALVQGIPNKTRHLSNLTYGVGPKYR